MIKCPHCGNLDIRVLDSNIVTEKNLDLYKTAIVTIVNPNNSFNLRMEF